MTKLLFLSLLNFGSANFMASTQGTAAPPKTAMDGFIEVFRKALEHMEYPKSTRKYWSETLKGGYKTVEDVVVSLDNGSCHHIRTTVQGIMAKTIHRLFSDDSPIKPIFDLIPTGGEKMTETLIQTSLKLAENGLVSKSESLLEECGPEDDSEDAEEDKEDFVSGMQGAFKVFKKALRRVNIVEDERVNEIVSSLKYLIRNFRGFITDVADGSCTKIKLAMGRLGEDSLKIVETKVELLVKDIDSLQSMAPILIPVLEQQFTAKLKARINEFNCHEKSADEDTEDDDEQELEHPEG